MKVEKGENDMIEMINVQKTYPNGVSAVKGLNVKSNQENLFTLLGQVAQGSLHLLR